jgi:fibronectin-binding autotransporter adhesin
MDRAAKTAVIRAVSGRSKRGRALAMAVAAAGGVAAMPRASVATTYAYTGPGGTATSPTTGTWTPNADWAGSAAPVSSTSNVLTFGGSGTAYTSTDDNAGAFSLNALVLGSTDTVNTDVIANISGSSLSFGGTAPSITQNGVGAFNIAASAALTTTTTFNGSGAGLVTISGVLSGAGGLVVANTGGSILILSTSDSYTGTTTINVGGTLQMGVTGSNGGGFYAGGAGAAITDNGTLIFDRTGIVTQGGSFTTAPITGTGNLVQAGTGLLTLNVAETYTGTTTIGAGTLQLGNGSAGSLSASGTIVDNGTLQFNRSTGITQGTDFSASAITGTGAITLAGSGTVVLNAANTYTGRTNLNAGVVNVAGTETPGTSGPLGNGGTISFAGGTLQFSAADTADYSARFSTAAGQAYSIDTNGQTVTFATGLTSTTGTLTKLGAGTLILTGASTYAGTTTISAGTLQLGNGPTGNLSATTAVVDNGTLAFARTNHITQGSGFGVISGSGTVVQSSAGGLSILNLNNTYGGGTSITGGTIEANTTGAGNSSTGSGQVTIGSGGILAGGTATAQGLVAGTVVVGSGGKITAGTGAALSDGVTALAVGNLSTGAQTWSGGGAYVAKVSADGTMNDQLVMAGLSYSGATTGTPFTVALNGLGGSGSPTALTTTPIVLATDTVTNVGVFQNAINAGTLTLTTSSVSAPSGYAPALAEVDTGGTEELVAEATATPEPTSMILLAAAGGPLLLARRRRRP